MVYLKSVENIITLATLKRLKRGEAEEKPKTGGGGR